MVAESYNEKKRKTRGGGSLSLKIRAYTELKSRRRQSLYIWVRRNQRKNILGTNSRKREKGKTRTLKKELFYSLYSESSSR